MYFPSLSFFVESRVFICADLLPAICNTVQLACAVSNVVYYVSNDRARATGMALKHVFSSMKDDVGQVTSFVTSSVDIISH